jgi:predicted ArsR family transcriptional regulator
MTGSDHIQVLAALAEPLRHQIYDHVVAQPGGSSRASVARALGVPRSVAAFHLDKLAALGLLEVDYRRPPGRSGPGAGRPAKWYRRSATEVVVSLPPRHYGLAAEILAQAVETSELDMVPVGRALRGAARRHGRALGALARTPGASAQTSAQQVASRVVELLAERDYQPRKEGQTVFLHNCPFAALAEQHRSLVCGMNFDLLRAAVEAAGLPARTARLDPAPGRCCVTLAA